MPDTTYFVDESATVSVVSGPPPIPSVMRFGDGEGNGTICIPNLVNVPGVMLAHGDSHVPLPEAIHLARMILLAAGEVDGVPQETFSRTPTSEAMR